MAEKICIRMKAYDHDILDTWSRKIVEAAKSSGARVAGPIPLPTRIEKYCVLRSPHVDKKSREEFEIRTHKRVVYITDFSPSTIEIIGKVATPRGVDLQVRQMSA
ncbi:30S ribosomal protein S10 [Planctomycetales bacterium]|jgi:small subunit ribosomal protein S10|nr:30S ribosomal protein S10 [Planctomycetales bacterium]GHT00840.1 30S ribosomal protein S10 [Planctomycetales bacterium]GHT08254.1 30S ribosomal protein S10 [Planctomycetales bacterium]GHV19865.1 30S ribosomal protein S10 [Planctomycetales bacterium]